MKQLVALLFMAFVFAGCNDKRVELVTINASAYVGANKVVGDFAILSTGQAGVFSDEGALGRYFATIQQNSKTQVTDFTAQVLPGEYILVIQLKDISTGAKLNTYTYNFITTRGTATVFNYAMQFQPGLEGYYQPWVDKK